MRWLSIGPDSKAWVAFDPGKSIALRSWKSWLSIQEWDASFECSSKASSNGPFECFFEWTFLEFKSKYLSIMLIERLLQNTSRRVFQNVNRSVPSECQSKYFFRVSIKMLLQNANRNAPSECQSKCSFRMPIEMLLQSANQNAPSECQSKCSKHHSKIFLFLRQGFVINHAGGRLWKTWEIKFWGATVAPVQFS